MYSFKLCYYFKCIRVISFAKFLSICYPVCFTVFQYSISPAFMSFFSVDGTTCKTTKSKLFGTALNDIEIVQKTLPDSRTTIYFYLDVATSVEAICSLGKVRSSHWRCSLKRVFLKVLQSSQENTCVGVSFLINIAGLRSESLLKRDSDMGVFL